MMTNFLVVYFWLLQGVLFVLMVLPGLVIAAMKKDEHLGFEALPLAVFAAVLAVVGAVSAVFSFMTSIVMAISEQELDYAWPAIGIGVVVIVLFLNLRRSMKNADESA